MSQKGSNDQRKSPVEGSGKDTEEVEDPNLEELLKHVEQLEELRGTRVFSYLLIPMELERDLTRTIVSHFLDEKETRILYP